MLKHCFLFAFLFCPLIIFSAEKSDTTLIALVNGEPLVFKELKMCEMKCRISANDSNFQQQKAFESAVLIKLQQEIAKESGIVYDISYYSFLKDFQIENNRRKTAIQNKEVVYGPKQFSEENYFDYKLSNLIIKLKVKLSVEKFDISDLKLMNFYETVKDSLYKMPDYLEVEQFDLTPKNKITAKPIQQKIIRELQSLSNSRDIQFDELKIGFINFGELKSKKIVFNPSQYQSTEGEEFAELENQLENIKVGHFSKPIFQNENIRFFRIKKRQKTGYRKFESVKNSLKTVYTGFLYEKYLSDKLKTAIIVRY